MKELNFTEKFDEHRKRQDIRDGYTEIEAEHNHLMRLLARRYQDREGYIPEEILKLLRRE